ncbi:MAG: hypothetical protein K2G46_03005, partial [Bacteroidales bacterium]|nr:hypothetical protein [Bacteroidales bacterium]
MDFDLFSAENGGMPKGTSEVQTVADTAVKPDHYQAIQEKRQQVTIEQQDYPAAVATAPATPDQDPKEMKAYQTEEILAAATRYFKGDALAANVWMNKYALKDSVGNIYE